MMGRNVEYRNFVPVVRTPGYNVRITSKDVHSVWIGLGYEFATQVLDTMATMKEREASKNEDLQSRMQVLCKAHLTMSLPPFLRLPEQCDRDHAREI